MHQLTTNDPRWQEWTDKFLASPSHRLTNEQAKNLIALSFLEHAVETGDPSALTDQQNVADAMSKTFPGQVFDKHAQRIGLVISPLAKAYGLLLANNVGTIVMVVHVARRIQLRTSAELPGHTLLRLKDLVLGMPDGFPDEPTLHAVWDDQKLTTEERDGKAMDNMLDYVVAA